MNDTAKLRIMESAGPIFAQKGFGPTTVREICTAAKVNQAAINYYFGSKENLYKEVFTSIYSTFTSWSQSIRELDADASMPFEERFLLLMQRRIREFFSRELSRWKIQLMFREIHDPTPACGETLRECIIQDYSEIYDFMGEYFESETPNHIRWTYIFNMFGSVFFYKSSGWMVREIIDDEMREQHFQPDQIAKSVVDMFLLSTTPYRRNSGTIPGIQSPARCGGEMS